MKKLFVAFAVLAATLTVMAGVILTFRPHSKVVTLTVSPALQNAVLHVWDGSDHVISGGQATTVNACAWRRPPTNNQGATGPSVAFWVQSAPGSPNYWGCDAPGSVGDVVVSINGRDMSPIPYHDPSACSGSAQLVNGFISAEAMGVVCN